MEAVVMSDGMSDAPKDKTAEQWKQIEQFLEDHDVIQNADVRQLCEVSAATASSQYNHDCNSTKMTIMTGVMSRKWKILKS